jgi:hypothetical protein
MDELREWHEFYALLGTAGATLVALLFVAVSISAGAFTRQRAAATRTFMSPVVVHFSTILLISLLALAPAQPAWLIPGLIATTSIVGICVSLFVTAKVVRDKSDEVVVTDALAYGVIPVLGYVATLAAAIMSRRYSPDLLAAGLLLLLLANIRNAWDLMLTMVRRSSKTAGS